VLTYRLSYRGLYLGNYQIRARRLADGGWHLHGGIVGFSPARALGFDLEMDSITTPALTTRRFEKRIRAPVEGEIRLLAVVGERVRALRYENGKLAGRYRAATARVWDDLSLLYHIRVRPEEQNVAFLGLYGLVQGPLAALGSTTIETPAGRFRAQGFRFDRPAAFFEIYLSGRRRLPVRIVFGFGRERVTALLLR